MVTLLLELVIRYTYIYVGLSALLVSTIWAMRRPLHRGTSIRLAPRFSFLYINEKSINTAIGVVV